MGASRQGRAGLPISVKLVVVTSIVVAIAVGTSTWFGQRSLNELTETQLTIRRQTGEHSIVRESELVVQSVAAAVATPLANTAYQDIAPLLDSAIAEDKKSGDNRIQWLVVTDASKTVVGKSGTAPIEAKLGELDRTLQDGIKNGDIAHAKAGAQTEWVYGAPIRLGASTLGTLRMGVSTAGLE